MRNFIDGGAAGLQAPRNDVQRTPVTKVIDSFNIFKGPAPKTPNPKKTDSEVPILKPFF